ncbi:MAG: gliding motility lipoprotein GldH [Tannerellaceae bacterium]|jgi:gliding motility-associated lipoprotein GldH|nr:gliding motility lipoprotein GldH [Tannerellaceae bacterium]
MTDPTTKPNRKTKITLIVFFSILCLSCKNEAVYNQYHKIDRFMWEKNKEYSFTFHIDDAAALYDITLEVRNNSFYPYQNLWIFYTERPPAGALRRDTIECILADDFGRWYGKGISLFQSGFPLRTRYQFPLEGKYTFTFRQGMRHDTLSGIQNIGLRVEQSAKLPGPRPQTSPSAKHRAGEK